MNSGLRSAYSAPHLLAPRHRAGSYDEAKVKAQLEKQIASRPCIVFSKSSCPFCKETKELLSKLGTMYTVVELDEVDGGMATQAELGNVVGRVSVPAVFAGGKYLGGCNDGGMGGIKPLHERGELKPLLVSAGALAADRV